MVNCVCAQSFQSRWLTRAPIDVRLCLSDFEIHSLFAVGGQWVWAQAWSVTERNIFRRWVEQGWNMLLIQKKRSPDDVFLDPVIGHRHERILDTPMLRIDCIEWEYFTMHRVYRVLCERIANRKNLGLPAYAHNAPTFLFCNQYTIELGEEGVTEIWARGQILRPSVYVLKSVSTGEKKKDSRCKQTYAEKIQEAIRKETGAKTT